MENFEKIKGLSKYESPEIKITNNHSLVEAFDADPRMREIVTKEKGKWISDEQLVNELEIYKTVLDKQNNSIELAELYEKCISDWYKPSRIMKQFDDYEILISEENVEVRTLMELSYSCNRFPSEILMNKQDYFEINALEWQGKGMALSYLTKWLSAHEALKEGKDYNEICNMTDINVKELCMAYLSEPENKPSWALDYEEDFVSIIKIWSEAIEFAKNYIKESKWDVITALGMASRFAK